MSFVCTGMSLVYHTYVIRTSIVYHSYVIRMLLVCTRISFVCNLISFYQMLNIKVSWRHCTSYIIGNVIFQPHWLKPFSNWSKYNAKPSLNTKLRQILMECFHFSEQRFPRICLKVPVVSVQDFLLAISDHRHIIIPIFHGESFGVSPVEMAMLFLCVFSCSREWPITFDAFLLVLYWSPNDFLGLLQGSYLVSTYLCFCIKYSLS